MAPNFDLSMARLQIARTLAWALLLGGWVGLGSLSQALAAGPVSAFALLALWLLALGAFAELIGRLRLQRWVLRGLLLCAALLAARSMVAPLHGGGFAALLPALLAWAIVIALASAAVRACRLAARTRPRSPVAAAAVGAALAWAWVGDSSDLNALGPRLMLGVLAACLLLVVLLPRRGVALGGCRAGLFDCSLPGWPSGGWRFPQRWPVLLASFVMLPMMCGLPWMLSLCRSDTVSPQALLALHFAAMFVPALLLLRRPAPARVAPGACAALLVLGALLLGFVPGPAAWWGLVLAHGAAWSVAWAAQLDDRARPAETHTSPLAGGALNALFTLALGLTVAVAGLQALTVWHVALGTAAALAVLAGPMFGPRALHPG